MTQPLSTHAHLCPQGARFAGKSIKELRSLGSDGWFYPQAAAEAASLREIIHDGFLHPQEAK